MAPINRRILRWPAAGPHALLGAVLIAGAAAQQGNLRPEDPPSAGAAGHRLELARTALEKLVDTRRAMARTAKDWQIDQERLQDNIALLQRDIELLRGKITDAEGNTAEADRKKAELAAEAARLKDAVAVFASAIGPLEQRTRALLRRLPEPLRERVRPLSQRIPETAEQAAALDEGKLSQRFLNVVGVLNEVDKWNREITVTSEVRPLGNGSSAEVTALYLGIGQGYYVNANGDAAGIGYAGDDGWVWTPRNDAAPRIAHAIAIAKNEKQADFVPLPLQLK